MAETIVAEIGVDMSRFPTDRHLASWVGLCPGQRRVGRQTTVGEGPQGQRGVAHRDVRGGVGGVAHQDTYLSAQFRRFKRRLGTKSEAKPSSRSRTR